MFSIDFISFVKVWLLGLSIYRFILFILFYSSSQSIQKGFQEKKNGTPFTCRLLGIYTLLTSIITLMTVLSMDNFKFVITCFITIVITFSFLLSETFYYKQYDLSKIYNVSFVAISSASLLLIHMLTFDFK